MIILLWLLCTPCYALNIPLAWNHDGNCTSFKIYRGFEGETGYPVLVGTVPCTEPYEFTDMDVPYGDLRWIVTAIKDDLESRPSNEATYAYYYPRVKYEFDTSGKILYKGENAVYAATDEDTTWVITKYYYDDQGRIIEIRVKEGAWTNRDQGW
jgi:YD repeat-containing protein